VKASNTNEQDKFGWSIALPGDTLAVGAFGEDAAATVSTVTRQTTAPPLLVRCTCFSSDVLSFDLEGSAKPKEMALRINSTFL